MLPNTLGRTRVPNVGVLDFDELDPEQVLVDIQDSGNNDSNGEVLLDFGVVQRQGFLDENAIEIAIVPDVELVVKIVAVDLVLLLLQHHERFAVLFSNSLELRD